MSLSGSPQSVLLAPPVRRSTPRQQSEEDDDPPERRQVAATVWATIERYRMLDRVRRLGVAVSGGADSVALLDLLVALVAERSPHPVELVPFYVKQYGHVDETAISRFVERRYGGALSLHVRHAPAEEPAARLLAQGRAPCRSCSAIRASAIAAIARELRLDAVALGHHLTDAIATLLMNMWHEAAIDTMRPITVRRRGGRVRIIRPLYHVAEADVKRVSPVGPDGLTDCGMCSRVADERAVNGRFVNDVLGRHAGSTERLGRLLDSLVPSPGRTRGTG